MPGDGQTDIFAPEKVKRVIEKGEIREEDIEKKVRNILRPCLRLGLYAENWHKPELKEREKIHSQVALATAREGIVLLKNEDLLPVIAGTSNKKVVLIGPLALRTPTAGRGSGAVLPKKAISLAEAFKKSYPDGIVLHEFNAEIIEDAEAVIVCVGNNENFLIKDYRKASGKVLDDEIIMDEQASFNDANSPNEGEGTDRVSFKLSEKHIELIKKCASLNDKIIVNIVAGSGVEMNSWIDKVKAVLFLFYPGENGTIAAMEIISGKINPSGKLPMSIEKNIEDNSAHENFNLDWADDSNVKMLGIREYQDVYYKEGVFVGYRHFSTRDIKPLFCFGHGLSYSKFAFSNLKVNSVVDGHLKISFNIKNVSDIDGYETAQVYIRDLESSVKRPAFELKGFSKVFIEKGKEKIVEIELDDSAFAFWSEDLKGWNIEDGEFEIMVGSSVESIHLRDRIFIRASELS
jgi:beta-glucosidase